MAGCEPALLPNKNGPVGNLTFRPGQPPPDLTRSDLVDRTDHTLKQHPPGLPEPSYVSLTLTTIADELERTGNRRDILTNIALRRAYTVSIAAIVGRRNLPTPVANEVSQKVAELLPDPDLTATHGATADRLRQLAEAV